MLSNKLQRQIMRLIHLGFGGLLGFFVYAPTYLTEPIRLSVQLVFLPIVTLSGIWMWYGPRILKRLKHKSNVAPSLPE